MGFIIVCASCALVGYLLGLSMAERIADHMIAEMRLEAGLDIYNGEDNIYDSEESR